MPGWTDDSIDGLRGIIARYAVAVCAVIAGVALGSSLASVLGSAGPTPYITLFAAVMFTARIGGLGPGIVTAILGVFAAQYFLVPPLHRFIPATLPNAIRAVGFVVFSTIVSVLNETVKRSRASSEERLRKLTLETVRRKSAEDEVRRNEERLKLAIDAGQIGVWDWDIIQDRIEWSDLVYDIHGLQRGTPPCGLDNFARLIHPDDQEWVAQSIRAALDKGAPYNVEFRVVHPNGDVHWVSTKAHVLRNEEGQPSRMLGATTDVTVRKQAEEEIRRRNRDLEEFAYVAGHDLREPLRTVNIYTHLIQRRLGEQDKTIGEYAGYVRSGILRMNALIDGLLTFSRVVLSEDQAIESADLSVVLNDALTLLRESIEEGGAVVRAEFLPRVRGNPSQIAHVFQNLISNALKYRRKEMPAEIHVSAEADGNRWIISVKDNGIGFEEQYADHIFGLFKRLHQGEYPGTGLGLAICARIVERYGGRIWAEGRPGEGATFHFSLSSVDSQETFAK